MRRQCHQSHLVARFSVLSFVMEKMEMEERDSRHDTDIEWMSPVKLRKFTSCEISALSYYTHTSCNGELSACFNYFVC